MGGKGEPFFLTSVFFLGEGLLKDRGILHLSITLVLVVPALEEEKENNGAERVEDVVEEMFGMKEEIEGELELFVEKVRGVASASCVVE